MPDTTTEHVLETMVEEVWLDLEVPDFTKSVLRRLDGPPAKPTEETPSAQMSGKLIRLGAMLGAAAALVVTVLLLVTPQTEDLPGEVVAGPDSNIEVQDGDVTLDSGWAALLDHDGELRAGGHTLRGDRFVVVVGAIPQQRSRDAIATRLSDSDAITSKEIKMLKMTGQWVTRGALALCILGGSVYVDGEMVVANENRQEPPKEDDVERAPSGEPEYHLRGEEKIYMVRGVESARQVPTDAYGVSVYGSDVDETLSALGHVERMVYLSLGSVRGLTATGIDHIATMTSLEDLRFVDTHALTDELLAGLAPLKYLREISFSFTQKVTGSGLAALSALPIAGVYIYQCDNFDNSGLEAVSKFRSLKYLSISGTPKTTGAGLASLKSTNLEVLHMTNCPHAGFEEVRAIGEIKSLRQLSLQACVGVENGHLAALVDLPDLENLTLLSTGITAGVVENVLVPMPNLKMLNIGRTSVSEADIKAVTKLKTLTYLSLEGLDVVTDDILSELKPMRLTGLNINSCNNLSENALRGLGDWSQLQSLRMYNAANATEATIAHLKRKLPDCSISG